jgi:carbohydrate-selective porin OprB
VYYNVTLTPWLSVSPLVQYIARPGGTNAYPEAVILGANIAVTF